MTETTLLTDPHKFQRLCWPQFSLYDKQVEIMDSVVENVETFVHAGNELGKDFISAMIALWFFASRSPAYVATTSSNERQLLVVLWGEMKRLVIGSSHKLPFKLDHLRIRRYLSAKDKQGQTYLTNELEPQSEIMGKVVQKGESFQGFHLPRGGPHQEIPRTLCIFDEASAIDDSFYDAATSWAHRILVIGNPMPCTNFFYKGCEGGDLTDPAEALLQANVRSE